MFRFRRRRRFIVYAVIVNVILVVVFKVLYLKDRVSLPDFSVNASKNFIQNLVPKPKRVLTFEIGRPKPEETAPTCRFTQSEGLQLLAENYLHPKHEVFDGKCSKNYRSICSVRVLDSSVEVTCEHNPCGETVKFGSLHKDTGELQWEDVSSSKLETFIKDVGLKSVRFMYPFFFLKCGGNQSFAAIHKFTQIISLPPVIHSSKPALGKTFTKESINVNIVFLDAISRPHFYRSLPKTIEAFRQINLNPKSTANVLDFELYQALKAKPNEALFGLIMGKGSSKSVGVAKPLLKHFKDAGYQTLWQEDLCWKFGHGFVQYFGLNNLTFKDKWRKMKQIMRSSYINSLGITHSSCYAFEESDVHNMNDYARKSICLNGKLQHEYFLEFLGEYLTEVDSKKNTKPLFSLTSLNLGQDEKGVHVQILDESLASFVQKMAGDKNTITFLISDHGNAFDDFPVQTNEGQYEQYNPFLFMILPSFVERRLGESKKKNLLNNQLRLISVSDIHDTVMSLVENPKNLNVTQDQGIFKEINFDRNCEQLGLTSSSLCICDGWKSERSASVFHYIIAEFALGQLNNMIAEQYQSQRSRNKEFPFTSCERLLGIHIKNISQKRIEHGYIITELDIIVQREDVFTVEVKWHGDNSPAMGMMLVNYKRKTANSKFTSCSSYIDKDLCVCLDSPSDVKKDAPNWKKYGSVFGTKTKVENRHEHCLYILTRDYTASTVFEAANMCDDVEYNVEMNFELESMRTPMKTPVNATISPKSICFLTFVTPLHLKNHGSWEYEINFTLNKRR